MTSSQTWPLTYDGKVVGKLVVGPRHGERRLSRSDEKVIDLVAAPMAIVMHAQVLTEDLELPASASSTPPRRNGPNYAASSRQSRPAPDRRGL